MDSPFRYTLLVALLLLAGLLCEATEYSILDFDLARRHELWMAEHGKVYKDEAERARRFEIFKDNVKYVEEFNKAGEHSYTLGINEFTDLTTEDFADMYLGGAKPPTEWEPTGLHGPSDYDKVEEMLNVSHKIPASIDWRHNGAVTPVRHQGLTCQSCWAFAAVAAVEGLHKIKKKILYELSEQQLIDCDSKNGGCSPGYSKLAMDYIIKNGGITTRSNYPYIGSHSTCNKVKEKAKKVSITGSKYLARRNETSLAEYVAVQPVVVLLEAFSRQFKQYSSGVYGGPCGGAASVNHAVVIVGYGEDAHKGKYWIIKNSWGKNWGESGYMRLTKKAGVGDGLCGVAAWPLIPTM